MKHIHPDIAGKEFDYVHLDEAFLWFAYEHCPGVRPEVLAETLENTIAAEHQRAIPHNYADHPRTIWEISTDHLIAHYQILPDRVEIGPMRARLTGVPYEPKHDLHATFTE